MTDKLLPDNFDGVIRFTNWSDEEFTAKWGGVEYKFQPKTTSPILIPSESAANIINISKKFALELARREYLKSPAIQDKEKRNADKRDVLNTRAALTYSEKELEPLISKALLPLPEAKATVTELPKKTPKKAKALHIIDYENNERVIGPGDVVVG